ncbi:MAG: GAF domain-containing protein [bacterium]
MTHLERDLFSLISLVSNVTESYSACLFLENRQRRSFQLTTFHSLSPHIISDASIKSGQGFMGWVLENNSPLSVNQFDKDTIVVGYYSRDEDIKSFMATPLPTTLTKGALAIDSKKRWTFTNKCQKILAGFAQQFAYLVDGALTAARLERRSIDVEAFNSYLSSLRASESEDQLLNAICLVPRELVPFDACFLVLRDEEAGVSRLVRTSGFGELFLDEVPISERTSIAGYVLNKCEPLRLPDLKNRPLFHPDEPAFGARSVVAVPLVAGNEAVGVLGFTSGQRGQFPPVALMRAEAIAAPASDALARVRSEGKWRRRAEFDPLTGGRNFRYLRARLGEILRDADPRGRRVALLSIAPDDPEAVMEEAGPVSGGDFILHLFGLLAPFGNGGDLLVRQEGTRFLLLLQGSSEEHAEAVADHIIQTVGENPFETGEREIPVTVSVGAACFPDDATEAEELVSASLRALDTAMSEGTNRISLGGTSSNAVA